MRKIALTLAILGTTLLGAFCTAPAHAQASRTWVSGVGDDANPCSRTAPCKTFAGAISKTVAGGEIDVLDPGGFGGVTITKAITLDGGGGQVGSVLVAGTNGINISAAATDVVILRNLRINGLLQTASPGVNGVNVLSAAQVVIDNCDIFGFNTNGLNLATGATPVFVEVRNSTFRNNAQNGISAGAATGGFGVVHVYNSSFVGTSSAGTSQQGGVLAKNLGAISVFNSNFQDLSYGAQVQSGGVLNVDSSVFSSVINGVLTNSGTSANVSNNSFYNGTAFGGAGSFVTANDNKIGGAQGSTSLSPMTIK